MSDHTQKLTIAAFQGQAVYDDLPQTLRTIRENILWAENNEVDILCFPECYLQGYIVNESKAHQVSLNLESSEATQMFTTLYTKHITRVL